MKTLITGMRKGELLPPYEFSFDTNKIKIFNSYLNSLDKKERIDCKGNIDARSELEKLQSEKQIEIMGSYGDLCVAATISVAMCLGMTTFSNEEYLFYSSKNRPLKNMVNAFNNYTEGVGITDLIAIGLGKEIKDFSYFF